MAAYLSNNKTKLQYLSEPVKHNVAYKNIIWIQQEKNI